MKGGVFYAQIFEYKENFWSETIGPSLKEISGAVK
jgi:hypothetical protein